RNEPEPSRRGPQSPVAINPPMVSTFGAGTSIGIVCPRGEFPPDRFDRGACLHRNRHVVWLIRQDLVETLARNPLSFTTERVAEGELASAANWRNRLPTRCRLPQQLGKLPWCLRRRDRQG